MTATATSPATTASWSKAAFRAEWAKGYEGNQQAKKGGDGAPRRTSSRGAARPPRRQGAGRRHEADLCVPHGGGGVEGRGAEGIAVVEPLGPAPAADFAVALGAEAVAGSGRAAAELGHEFLG